MCERDLVKEERRKPKGALAQQIARRRQDAVDPDLVPPPGQRSSPGPAVAAVQQQDAGSSEQTPLRLFWVKQGQAHQPAVTAWLHTTNQLLAQGLLDSGEI